MMNEIVMRRITLEDVPALSLLAKKTFYDAFACTCTPADMEDFLEKYYSETVLATEVQNESYQYFFAILNDEIIGYSLFAENNNEFAALNKKSLELKRFYVQSEYHSKGIAQKMMDHYLKFATENNYELAFLGVWEYNYKAQNFYKKYGFEKTNHHHNFPVGDTSQMDVYLIKHLVH
jgi:diamine N-acetyltransferase